MTIKFAYNCLALREYEDIGGVVFTLTRVWANTLGLRKPA